VLDMLFEALVRYAAPVLVFTAEEVWGTRYPEAGSVHLLEWPEVDSAGASDEVFLSEWKTIRVIRAGINESIEPLRRDKRLGSSLEANVSVPMHLAYDGQYEGVDWTELCIAASVELVPPLNDFNGPVTVSRSEDHKCGRCWRHLPDVSEDGSLCSRCEQVVEGMDASA